MSLTLARLIDVAEFNPSTPRNLLRSESEVAFVPMTAVSELGTMQVQHRSASIVSSGLSYFADGDILVAKITPCYENNKITVAKIDREHGFGSTEFHVVRPDKSRLNAQYLSYFLRQDAVRQQGTRRMTGSAGQRRVPKAFLEQLQIPSPPLDEQRRIAAILDQADTLRRKRREALLALQNYSALLFQDIFGDPESLPSTPLGELIKDNRIGLVRGASEFGDGMPFPYVRMNAITRQSGIDFSTIQTTNASTREVEDYALQPGDFLFNTRNSRELVGKVALWGRKGTHLYNNNIMRIRFLPSIEPRYALAAFNTPAVQRELEKRKTGTTSVFAVYWRDLKTLPFPVASMQLQQRFARAMDQWEALHANNVKHLSHLDTLFASLQHRAFRGEL